MPYKDPEKRREAAREAQARRRAADPEKAREKSREDSRIFRSKNPEKVLETNRNWYANNPEKARAGAKVRNERWKEAHLNDIDDKVKIIKETQVADKPEPPVKVSLATVIPVAKRPRMTAEEKKLKQKEYDRTRRLVNLEESRKREREQKQRQRDADPEKAREYNRNYRLKNIDKAREQSRAANIRWKANHPEYAEYMKEYGKAYRALNAEKVAEGIRRWNEAHPEKLKGYSNKYDSAHREEINQKARDRRIKDPEAVRAAERRYRATHPEILKNGELRRKAASGDYAVDQIKARIAFFGNKCAYCPGPYEHLDHVIPISKGGTHWPSNLRPSCKKCNLSKGARDWRDWKIYL